MLRRITLRQLKVFETVARLSSHTRAAEELFLTQPAVSMQIKQLEKQLGVVLFEQLGKRIHLTEAGRETLHYARAVEQQLDELESILAHLNGVSGGRLRISVASTANYFMPVLLAEFSQRHPGVKATLDITNRQALVNQLTENSVDLVVMGQPPTEIDVEAQIFLENPLVIVAPPHHPLARTKRIPLKRLETEVFLVREPGSGTRSAMERFFKKRGITIKTGMEVGSNEAIKQSVEAGLGLGLLSRATLEQEIALGRLAVLDVVDFPILRQWYVVHRRGKRLLPVAQTFKTFLLAEARVILGRRKPGRDDRVDPL